MVFRRRYKGTRMAATTARMRKPSSSGRVADGVDERLLPFEVSFIVIASFSLQDSSVSSRFWQKESLLPTGPPIDRPLVSLMVKRFSVVPVVCAPSSRTLLSCVQWHTQETLPGFALLCDLLHECMWHRHLRRVCPTSVAQVGY